MNFFSLLTLLFVGLKLTGYVSWSWLWVLAPMWGFFAMYVVTAIGAAIIVGSARR